jgi:hypothetical protein
MTYDMTPTKDPLTGSYFGKTYKCKECNKPVRYLTDREAGKPDMNASASVLLHTMIKKQLCMFCTLKQYSEFFGVDVSDS